MVRVECPPGVAVPAPGVAVSVLGVVALEPVGSAAPPAPLPAGALVVRDVRVVAWPEGVVVVEERSGAERSRGPTYDRGPPC